VANLFNTAKSGKIAGKRSNFVVKNAKQNQKRQKNQEIKKTK
jgi:hypothetical protein